MSIFKGAIWRAILYPYIFIVLFFALLKAFDYPSPDALTYMLNPIVMYFYFLISLGGWLLIGYPIHGLAKTFFNSNKAVYFVALFFIFLMFTILSDMPVAAIICAPMLVQLILFLIYFDVLKKHNKPIKRD